MKNLYLVSLLMLSLSINAQKVSTWILDEYSGPGLDLKLNVDAVNQQEGLYAAEFQLLTTEVPYIFSEYFDVTEGAGYTFGIDVWDNDTTASLKIYMDFEDANGDLIDGESPDWSSNSASWQTIGWSGTVPAGAVVGYIQIKAYDDPGFDGTAKFLLDNAMYNEGGATSLVPNAGFEEWDVLFSEGFENNMPEGWSTIDLGTNPGTWRADTLIEANQGEGHAAVDAYDPDPADDWLITIPILVRADHELSLYSKSRDTDYKDDLNLMVSKTGTLVGDFTITLDQIIEVPNDYTKYSYVLSAQAGIVEGDTVYVGMHCNSNGSWLYIDDVRYGEASDPAISKAYAISETEVEVFFDSDLAAVTAGDFSLSGSQNLTFSGAAIDGSNSKLVHLSGASASMTGDNVLDTLTYSALSTSTEFYAGILPLTFTSTTNPGGTIDIEEHFATFKGIVMATDSAGDRHWLQDAAAAHHGVNTFELDGTVALGDEILVLAQLSPYQNQTELYLPTLIEILSSGNALYDPLVITGTEIAASTTADTDPAEKYEGLLVKVNDVEITRWDGEFFTGNDGNANINVGDQAAMKIFSEGPLNDASGVFEIEKTYDITGLVVNRGGSYVLTPRNSDDVVESTSSVRNSIESISAVYPNPAADKLFIALDQSYSSVELIDITGKKVAVFNATSTEMDISQLKAGLYLVKITLADGTLKTDRLIKK